MVKGLKTRGEQCGNARYRRATMSNDEQMQNAIPCSESGYLPRITLLAIKEAEHGPRQKKKRKFGEVPHLGHRDEMTRQAKLRKAVVLMG